MRQLSSFTPEFNEATILLNLANEYNKWIERQRDALGQLEYDDLKTVAERHLEQSMACLARIRKGIAILEENTNALNSFRLANLAMLLQQIATKKLKRRPLVYDQQMARVRPQGEMQSPWLIYKDNKEGYKRSGSLKNWGFGGFGWVVVWVFGGLKNLRVLRVWCI